MPCSFCSTFSVQCAPGVQLLLVLQSAAVNGLCCMSWRDQILHVPRGKQLLPMDHVLPESMQLLKEASILAPRKVARGYRMVTSPMTSCDPMTS